MVWWVPLAMAAGGYVLDKQTGGDGTKGAIGGLTMGYGMGAGGAAGASGGAAGGKGANTAANSTFAGNALGQGGGIMGGSAVNAGLGTGLNTGLNTGLQNVTNRITGSGFQPYGMTETLGNSITGVDAAAMNFQDLGLNVNNAILDPITGMPIGPDMSQNFPINSLDYVPENLPPLQDSLPTSNLTAPNWTPDRNVVSGTDGYEPETSGMFGDGLLGRGLGYLGDFVPDEKDLGAMAIGMGVNALTPEQQERIRHQQAMVSRGQTGSLLGQGGYQGIGGQYISRAK